MTRLPRLFHDRSRPTRSQTATRLILGGFMSVAGLAHLTFAREEFRAQVPDWLPGDADVTVLASGVVELGFGIALLGFPKHRRVIGLALAVFFVAIFPGNIAQYVEGTDAFGLDTDAKRFARLFGQPLLIAAALWAAGLPGRGAGGADPSGGARPRSGLGRDAK